MAQRATVRIFSPCGFDKDSALFDLKPVLVDADVDTRCLRSLLIVGSNASDCDSRKNAYDDHHGVTIDHETLHETLLVSVVETPEAGESSCKT